MPEYFPQDDSTYPLQVKKITVEDDVNPENANAAPEALSKRTDYLNAQLILLASQLSNISFDGYTKSESDQLLADLIDGAPDALNTLNELAVALGDNDSEIAALLSAISTKLPSSDYTAADVLAKLLTVDGVGSYLDADEVRGLPADFSANLNSSGYQKLPSGLIIQWGIGQAGAVSGAGYNNILPITFPSNCLFAIAVHFGGNSTTTNIILTSLTASYVGFKSAYPSNNITVNYMAIGY